MPSRLRLPYTLSRLFPGAAASHGRKFCDAAQEARIPLARP